jgi:glycosyltransferase involved in cell wall biosynthesis
MLKKIHTFTGNVLRSLSIVKWVEKGLIRLVLFTFFSSCKKRNPKTSKPRLFWGTIPILNYKYWNEALRAEGYDSKTVMYSYFAAINKKTDFDIYLYEDILTPKYLLPIFYSRWLFPNLAKVHWILYIAKNFDILNISLLGVVYRSDDLWKYELKFYKKLGLKIVALPYGADYQRYSKIYSKSWHHVLLINYPQGAIDEPLTEEKVTFLTQHADCIMAGFQFDQLGRWDILPYAIYPMDCTLWQPKTHYSENDGINGVVKVYHTPNHRGVKGTEFLIEAVNSLKEEGLKVELILLEKIQNDKVRQLLHEDADILVEQLILSYALSAIEGMATGLPVISNLDEEIYTRVFRRYSYLNECPILSSTPERIKEDLRTLIINPELRKQLGMAGRKYVEKYNSFEAMSAIFSAIYDKIWYGKNVDLINFFNSHNKDSYSNKKEKIKHPLFENKLPLASANTK